MTEESQNELLLALEEDSSHLLSELLHLTSSEDFILRKVNALYRSSVGKLLDSYWIVCKPIKVKQSIECQEKIYPEFTQHAIERMTHRFCNILISVIKWVMDMSHPNLRLARKARPRRTTSRNNANLVYEDVINATKENLNQSGKRFK